MNRVIIALAVGMVTAGPALASDKSDIMAVVNQWNDTDEAKSVATCADDAAVIDDIPPYEWHGPSACSNWQKDYDAYLQKNGMTDATGTVGKPRQLLITGDRAYAVVPATFSFTKDGKPVKASATATFALHKTAAGWRITGWAWTNKP
jgi:ketosteroid isomerase-like protein